MSLTRQNEQFIPPANAGQSGRGGVPGRVMHVANDGLIDPNGPLGWRPCPEQAALLSSRGRLRWITIGRRPGVTQFGEAP